MRTIRYDEEGGLVVPSARSQDGFRLYMGSDVARLPRIGRLEPLEFTLEEMREAPGLLDEVTGRADAADAPRAVLLERLAMHRELADQRTPVLHERWSSAGGLADDLRRPEERLRQAREIHS